MQLRIWTESVALGLANSSCCALQLILNAFGYACAGFSVFDAYRPICIAISVILGIRRISEKSYRKLYFFVMIVLSAMPYAVRLYNSSSAGRKLIAGKGEFVGIKVEFSVDQVFCDACANALKQELLRNGARIVRIVRDDNSGKKKMKFGDDGEYRVLVNAEFYLSREQLLERFGGVVVIQDSKINLDLFAPQITQFLSDVVEHQIEGKQFNFNRINNLDLEYI